MADNTDQNPTTASQNSDMELASLRTLAERCNVPFVDLSYASLDAKLLERFDAIQLHEECVLPLALAGDRLTIAVGDPFKLEGIARNPLFEDYDLETVLADEQQIAKQLKRAFGLGNQTIHELLSQTDDAKPTSPDNVAIEADPESPNGSIARFIDELLHEAVEQRASDVHIERDETGLRVRFRVDGMLRLQNIPSHADRFQLSIISRLKILAGLNIAEKRLPQDGRFDFSVRGRTVDVRVSIVPMVHGEEVALRLVDKSQVQFNLDRIGMPEETLAQWKQLIRRPHGMILVTGPTGSGKTTTLYASLRHIRSTATKIVTVEDPVEHTLVGINQVQVREQIGLTFGEILRRLLRHDPDVMLIGEVRDTDTANNAVQASLTGHLVLTTLHANDSSSAYTRLVDMGVEPYLVASTVIGVASQRLVRRLCMDCREAYQPHPDEVPDDFDIPENTKIYRARGCRQCSESGYVGRVALTELLVPDEEIRRLCLQNAAPSKIRAAADMRGMVTLRQTGWSRVLEGVTSVSEIVRLTEFATPLASKGTRLPDAAPTIETDAQSPARPIASHKWDAPDSANTMYSAESI